MSASESQRVGAMTLGFAALIPTYAFKSTPMQGGVVAASTTPPARSLVTRHLPFAEKGLVTRHFTLGMTFAQVPYVGIVIGHAAAEPRGLH
jgi:hypothetical protein